MSVITAWRSPAMCVPSHRWPERRQYPTRQSAELKGLFAGFIMLGFCYLLRSLCLDWNG